MLPLCRPILAHVLGTTLTIWQIEVAIILLYTAGVQNDCSIILVPKSTGASLFCGNMFSVFSKRPLCRGPQRSEIVARTQTALGLVLRAAVHAPCLSRGAIIKFAIDPQKQGLHERAESRVTFLKSPNHIFEIHHRRLVALGGGLLSAIFMITPTPVTTCAPLHTMQHLFTATQHHGPVGPKNNRGPTHRTSIIRRRCVCERDCAM